MLGGAQCRQTHQKQNIQLRGIIRLVQGQWTEDGQGLGEAPALHQGSPLMDPGIGRRRRAGLFLGTQWRSHGQEDKG